MRAGQILRQLLEEFSAVLIDTPPLSVSDARILGNLVDGVVLVIRADQTAPEVASSALHRLLDDGANVLGGILNSWDPRKTSNRQNYVQHLYSDPLRSQYRAD